MSDGRDDERWLTREALFEAAWDRPLEQVAAELGITPTALKRTCDRHDIPTPGGGYWAAVQAGGVFPRPSLRPVNNPRLEKVHVQGALAPPGQVVGAARQEVAKPASVKPRAKPDVPKPTAPVNPPTTARHISPPKIAVPATLASPHWIVAAWIEEERRNREMYRLRGWGIGSRQPTPLEKRTRLILNGLFKALERRGYKATTEQRSIHLVHLVIQDHRFDYTLVERYTQRRVPLTAAELKLPENASVNRQYRQVRETTGQLQLMIKTSYYNKTVWRDEPERLLEDQLGEIVADLEAMAVKETEAKALRDAAEKARREEEHRRYEEQRRAKRDQNQWRRLRELATREEEAQRMRRFVEALRSRATNEGVEDEEVAAWLAWAEEWIAAWDPLSDGLAAIMAEVKNVTDWDYRDRT